MKISRVIFSVSRKLYQRAWKDNYNTYAHFVYDSKNAFIRIDLRYSPTSIEKQIRPIQAYTYLSIPIVFRTMLS